MFRCGKKFVGDTARTLDKRVQVCELLCYHCLYTDHCIAACQSILDQVDRRDDNFVVSEHFTRPDHAKDDLRVQILEAGTNRTSWDRDAAKGRWIRKLLATDAGGD